MVLEIWQKICSKSSNQDKVAWILEQMRYSSIFTHHTETIDL